MSVQVENLEKNMARLTIEVPAEDFEKALNKAYQKQKGSISIPGFRKGKVPRAVVEKMYGAEIFYEDAANDLMDETYAGALEESGVDYVSRPTVDIVQIEKGKAFIYTADVAVRPEVTLGAYKGVTVTAQTVEVSDEEVQSQLELEQGKNSRMVSVTDQPVASGDTAVIDFEGFVDGVAFEGGKGENYSLEIGSHSFIDNFEDQLIGANVGDELDVNVTFPEQYQEASLAGQPALFKVKVNDIQKKELPEIDDEFAQDVSEFDTLEEYKASVKEDLLKKKTDELKSSQVDEAIVKIIADSEMEIPEAMIDTQVENMIDDYAQQLQQQYGVQIDQYLQMMGMTMPKFREQMRPEALHRIQNSLVLEQIVKEENIEVSDEEVEAEIVKMAEAYGLDVEQMKQYMGDTDNKTMRREMQMGKAMDLIGDTMVPVEAEPESTEDVVEDAAEVVEEIADAE